MNSQEKKKLNDIQAKKAALKEAATKASEISEAQAQLDLEEFGLNYESATRVKDEAFAVDQAAKKILRSNHGKIVITVEAYDDGPKNPKKFKMELDPELLNQPTNKALATNAVNRLGEMVTGISGWALRKMESDNQNLLVKYRNMKSEEAIAENKRKIEEAAKEFDQPA